MSKRKKQRATAWIDFCRLILCGLGCFFIGTGATRHIDEERPWSLGVVIFFVVFGLLLAGIGIFAKPRTAKRVAESLNP
jgi:hypothetical protein